MTYLIMSMCRVISCIVGRGHLLWSVCLLDKTVSLCPASFCTVRPNLPIILCIPWLPTFAFQSPMMKRASFFHVRSRRCLGLHRTSQLQLLWHQWLGHRLVFLWCWMVCPGNEPRSFCHFWDCTQVLYFRLFVYYEGYSTSFKGFLPTVVDTRVIWIKFIHSHPF